MRQKKDTVLSTNWAYEEIAEALAYIGDIEVALEIAKNSNANTAHPTKIKYAIVQSLAKAKNTLKAIEIFKNVKGPYVKSPIGHYYRSWALLRIGESLLEGDFPRVADWFSSCSGY